MKILEREPSSQHMSRFSNIVETREENLSATEKKIF